MPDPKARRSRKPSQLSVSVHETGPTVRHGFGPKKRVPGERRSLVGVRSEPSLARGAGVWCRRDMLNDHPNDYYVENITDDRSGEVLHHCDEALSVHKGHGDDKENSRKGKTRYCRHLRAQEHRAERRCRRGAQRHPADRAGEGVRGAQGLAVADERADHVGGASAGPRADRGGRG
jgi:hypothetical protein